MSENAPTPIPEDLDTPESKEREPLDSVETLADMLLDEEKLATLPEDEESLIRISAEVLQVFDTKKDQLKGMTSAERGSVWDMAEQLRGYLDGLLSQRELSAAKYDFIESLCTQFYDLREMVEQEEEREHKKTPSKGAFFLEVFKKLLSNTHSLLHLNLVVDLNFSLCTESYNTCFCSI